MKRRLIICADRSFPRGDAGANRILFMAKALQEKEWDIFVISIGRNEEKNYDERHNCYSYEGVKYRNINTVSNQYIRTIQHNLIDGRQVVRMMRRLNVTEDDKILLYSSSYTFSSAVINYANKTKCKIASDVVEWHQPFQFKKSEKDIKYKAYKKFFETLVPKTKNVIAISKCLEKHFSSVGCNVVIVPIYVDMANRNPWHREIDKDHLHLIYPGNPYRKDDLLAMLQALDMLNETNKEYVRFHLTGVNKGLLYECIPGDESLLDSLVKNGTVIIHSWMEYEDLLKLYQTIDFALLARPVNRVTEANFPSKVPELMSKGIPVITNRIGDIISYLDDGKDSILYDNPTAESCMSAIERVIKLDNDSRIKLSKAAYGNADTKFNYHLCSEQLDKFFSNLR